MAQEVKLFAISHNERSSLPKTQKNTSSQYVVLTSTPLPWHMQAHTYKISQCNFLSNKKTAKLP